MFWHITGVGVLLLSSLLLLFVCFFLTKNPTRIPAVYFLKQKTQSQKITLVPLFIQFSAKIMPVDSKVGKFPWMDGVVVSSGLPCRMESSCGDVNEIYQTLCMVHVQGGCCFWRFSQRLCWGCLRLYVYTILERSSAGTKTFSYVVRFSLDTWEQWFRGAFCNVVIPRRLDLDSVPSHIG